MNATSLENDVIMPKLLKIQIFSSHASGRAKCELGWNWRPLDMPDYDIWYVVSGKGELTLNGIKHPLAAGTCFLFRPGDEISAEQDPEMRLTVMFMHFQIVGLQEPSFLPHKVNVSDTVWCEQMLNQLLALEEMSDDGINQIQFDLLIKLMLCHLIREKHNQTDNKPSRHHAIPELVAYIKENIASPLDREHLAEISGLSPRYLGLLFKQQMGVTLQSYISRARIERAAVLLAESTMNISQIAETLGYTDIYFFSRQFKQYNGEAPSHYRQRIRSAVKHY